jgi:hypothetical protein
LLFALVCFCVEAESLFADSFSFGASVTQGMAVQDVPPLVRALTGINAMAGKGRLTRVVESNQDQRSPRISACSVLDECSEILVVSPPSSILQVRNIHGDRR